MPGNLHSLIAALEADSSLFNPDQLRRRIDVLDLLEAQLEYADPMAAGEPENQSIRERTERMRLKLEAANAASYQSICVEIQGGSRPENFLRWIGHHKEEPNPGLGYDYLDEVMSGVFQWREPTDDPHPPGPEMVFYQPTPVRHIIRMIEVCSLSEADVLIDFGAGLGHVSMLTSILAGNRSIGIELEPAYVACAREAALSLGLDRVTFLQQDARDADFSEGTVFYLYTPFSGSILRSVLDRLRRESEQRSIRVCTLGPCTVRVAEESWLRPMTPPLTDQICCFHSCA